MFYFCLLGERWGFTGLYLDTFSLITYVFAVTVPSDAKVGALSCW